MKSVTLDEAMKVNSKIIDEFIQSGSYEAALGAASVLVNLTKEFGDEHQQVLATAAILAIDDRQSRVHAHLLRKAGLTDELVNKAISLINERAEKETAEKSNASS